MSTSDPDDSRATFERFSGEYAQAMQAYQAIANQASALLLMGYTDDLRGFVEQFITMAERTRDQAAEQGQSDFADRFGELVRKGEALRTTVARRN
jgi:hypothetical protein